MRYNKELTAGKAIQKGPEPNEAVFPMIQHVGEACEPLVDIGAKVKVGQKIAEAKAFITAPIHSSISGIVTGIMEKPHPIGTAVKAIIIDNDWQNTPDESIKPYPALEQMTAEEIVEAVKEAGIVGLGGATFPTHVKLSPPKQNKIDTLILNGAECEPYLTSDHRVMLERAGDIIYGAKAMAKALNVSKIIIAIEDNKEDAIKKLTEEAQKGRLQMDVFILKTQYPQGSEKILVKTVLGRKLPPLGLPLDAGVVVHNVSTAAQVGKTLKTGLPLIDRVVTVGGEFKPIAGNYLVKLGTPMSYLLTELQNVKLRRPKPFKLVMGGPMMGLAQWTMEVPVIKGTTGILTLSPYNLKEWACIRCGRCIKACPMGLQPLFDADDSCIECGCCAYICPAKRQLVQRIKVAKAERRKEREANR
ncbi:MAG: electron transport complex subunit RsxC [Candidatus Margulisiibacteriota bacterium]|jgi:electron transport complex protein RnfC